MNSKFVTGLVSAVVFGTLMALVFRFRKELKLDHLV